VIDMLVNIVMVPRFGATAAAYTLLSTGVLYTVCVGVGGARAATAAATSSGIVTRKPISG
jgi:hypothetical protein